ncbi:PEP/pyruvate-binding domain-containing protein [Geodermatophilus sp. SYSU D00815]
MTSRFTRPLAGLRLTDRPAVGGKCASLGELLAAGIAVPDGFAVTVDAFELFRDTGGLRDRLKAVVLAADAASPSSLEAAQREAIGLIDRAELPADVVREIREGYASLCARAGRDDLPVAVRSSAVAEDGDAASFAGQQETYLWVVGADDVVEHVRACWASLYTPQAIAYRSGLDDDEARRATQISVGVQTMVDAAVAGVAFTVSPRTGDRSVVAVNASWGLGHAVVSGEVTPDEFFVSKADWSVTSRRVAHKAHRCLPDPSGSGTVTVEVPPELRDRPCLDDATLRELAELAVRVERHYGCPQDIEWALDRHSSSLVLLQSRPETTWRTRKAEARAKQPATGYLGMLHTLGSRP